MLEAGLQRRSAEDAERVGRRRGGSVGTLRERETGAAGERGSAGEREDAPAGEPRHERSLMLAACASSHHQMVGKPIV